MLWRSNKGKDQTDDQTDNRIKPGQKQKSQKQEQELQDQASKEASGIVTRETMGKDEFLQSEEAKEVYEKLVTLRKSLSTLKQPDTEALHEQPLTEELPAELTNEDSIYLEETAAIAAAEKAIIEQARKDAEEERLRREQVRLKEIAERQEAQKILEARKRAEQIEEEAALKRQQAIEAKKKALEISSHKVIEDMSAEIKQREKTTEENKATVEEREAFFNDDNDDESLKKLDEAKEELLFVQQKQSELLEQISEISESKTEQLAEEQKAQTEKSNEIIKEHKLETVKAKERVRKQQAETEKAKALAKVQKAEAEKARRLEREQRKKEEKAHRAKNKERNRQKKKKETEAKIRAAAAAAEIGGGVVKVNGVAINTEIKTIPQVSWRDFFGLVDKREKKAKSKAEQRALKKEREKRREEARAVADGLGKRAVARYNNSRIGRRMHGIKLLCEQHKAGLILSFAIVLTAVVGTAGIFNYCTAYEYSYNGKELGIVKEKDEVLRITDLIQGALTEDKNVDVIIDAKDDITFKRVPAMGSVKIDSTEEVLKRLTYMGDLNVKAYGIYVDGKKVGAVESKETAAGVMEEIKSRYASGKEGAEIEEAVFIEDVEVRKSNTGLQNVSSKNEMINLLCTSGEKETLHKVIAGETLADISGLYSMEEKDILKDNQDVDPKKLEVGSTIVIKQNAPILTVKITELVTYDKPIKYEVEKKDSKNIYEGYTETKQKGKNGLSEITARIESVNGETIKETALVTTIKKEPVEKVVLVGVKERPPTVGSGKYIWPLSGGYRISSSFGQRWGRMHSGIDMACSQGHDVMAADGGTVTKAGYNGSYGYLVVIDHQNGMETYYAHNSELLVSVGDKVFQGQHIAESGNTGRSTGAHLHFEVHVDGVAQNPMNFLP